jgi:acetyltransferase
VVVAGGFGEVGSEGRRLEDEMVAIARQYGLRLIGPNTSGMINLKSNLNLVGLRDTPKGNIALLTQSGNMALTIITEARLKSRKGFSYYVGVGNEADIKFHEYLEFFRKDPDTQVVLIYVEGMRMGREFLQQAHKTTLHKPVILLKSGRSTIGKRSAGSHTGALAGISEVAKSAFERAGIVVIENPDELFPAAETLSSLPPIKNNQVAILADGGGHATIAADLLTDLGVAIPELSEKTKKRLQEVLPSAASLQNPIDVAGGTDADPTVFATCAQILMRDPAVGGLLIVGLFGGYGIRFAKSLAFMEEDAAHQLGKLVKKRKKPIIVHSLYSSVAPHSLDLLRYYNIPVYDALNVACKCTAVMAQYGAYLSQYHVKTNFVFNWQAKARPDANAIIQQVRQDKRRFLLEPEGKRLLTRHGIPIAKEFVAQSRDEVVRLAKKVKGPVALKIISPDILHKSDAGGVKLYLKTDKEVRQAYNDIIHNAQSYGDKPDIRGVLVSPMVSEGVEVIIGTKIDDQFGPVIMYGLGGVLVEVLKDVSFRVLPISSNSAKQMIEDIKSASLLNGFRGIPPCDKPALGRLLLKCSEIVEAYPDIQEMDLNPVILHAQGLSIVDVRIILKEDPLSK